MFIQAHPFRDNIITVDTNLIDGIETLNFHYNHYSRNAACTFYAKENSIDICTGGSDFHYDINYHAASVLMLSKTIPEDSFALVKLLKSKANSGIIHGGYDPEPGTLKAKMNTEGVPLLYEAAKELNVPHKNNGSLIVAFEEEEEKTVDGYYKVKGY